MRRTYYSGRNVQRALSIEELRQMALRHLPRFAAEFLEGGAEDELTLAWNRDIFRSMRLVPTTLVDTARRNTRVTVLAETCRHR